MMRKDEMMLVELRCQHGVMDVLGDAKGRGDVGGVKTRDWYVEAHETGSAWQHMNSSVTESSNSQHNKHFL